MITVNSISGGRTSGYLASHYPADLEVFALVCADDHNCGGWFKKPWRRHYLQYANDKLQKHCPGWPEFVATTEDPIIIQTMMDLEQHLGREIIWVRGMSWEQLLKMQQAIPNREKRFCTTILKLWPVFYYLRARYEFPVRMGIGYRYDEQERRDSFTTDLKIPTHLQYYGNRDGFMRSRRGWLQRWTTFHNWREGYFPLIENKVNHFKVRGYWEDKTITWPKDSNCQNCFWKHEQQLRKNFDENPQVMKWAGVAEAMYGHTFRDDYSLFQISRMALQTDFFFGTGAGCQAGNCTD